jgi:ABC-type multidrug transport system permease subunit
MVGLNSDPGRFSFFLFDLFLSFMVAESIMLLVSAVVPVAILGIALGAMVYGAFMVVQGFFIKLENIGWWWRWLHWLGMHSYSFSAFMYNEFHGRVFDAAPHASGGPQPQLAGDAVLAMYDFDDVRKWDNMAVLIAMSVGYRAIAAWVMYKFHTGKK